MPLTDDAHREIEMQLRRRLVDLVVGGHDVVLDFSFWSRAVRDEWRRVLEPFRVVPELDGCCHQAGATATWERR